MGCQISQCNRSNTQRGQKIKYDKAMLQYKFKPNLKPSIQNDISPQNISLYTKDHHPTKGVKISLKVPLQQGVKTKFKWIHQQKWSYPSSIKDLSPQFISKRSFQQKSQWFKIKLQQRKISWQKGCQNISVDRQNILNSSFEQLSKINITKQVKVNFTDQKNQNDAGGIFREWMHLCMKQIFGNQMGLFTMCQTQQTFYKFNINQDYIQNCLPTASLLGYLIAKSLMQRVPINCHLNFTIWRQILQQRITLHDIFSFDQDLYHSWKCILENVGICQDFTFETYVFDKIANKNHKINLIDNGKKIKVTENNKQQFIQRLIQANCVKLVKKPLQKIKATLYEIIPIQYLAIFQPYQIDSLLCGQQIIDLKDWKQHTIYQDYKQTDLIIKWFWTAVQSLSPDMVRNLLHYCTGCSRVPVTGFKYLQSNRGQIKKFTIKKGILQQHNKYPKSYTCFNRLQLPPYQSYDELLMMIFSITNEEIVQINIDA